MNINWKVRFQNKVFLITFITSVIAFIYQLLSMFEVVPKVSQDTLTQLVTLIINLLVTLGIVTDPTTNGVSDSERAMEYQTPGGDK